MNAQWGSFTKPHHWGTCPSFGQDSFRKRDSEVFGQGDGDYMIVGRKRRRDGAGHGGSPSDNTGVSVSAFSSDAAAAEQARNTVCEDIVRSQTID
jgi:hypothetical protein